MNLEALFIIASVIGSIISTLTGNILYVSAPLTLALLMNFINRGKVQQKTLTEVHNSEDLIASLSQLGAKTQELSEIIYTLAPVEKLEKLEVDLDSLFGMVQNELELINTELAAKVNNSENLSRQDIETKRLEKLEAQLKSKFGSLESQLIIITTDLTARVNSCENSIALLSQLGAETQQLSETIDTKASIEKLENLEAQLSNKFELLQNRLAVISTELTEKLNKSENSTASLSQLGTETRKLSEIINTKASTEKLEKLEGHLNNMSKSLQNELAVLRTELTEKLNKSENSIASLLKLGAETEKLTEIINTKAPTEKLEKLEERLDDTSNYLQTQLYNLRAELDTSPQLITLDDKILKINSYLDSIVTQNFKDVDKNLLSVNRKFTFQQEQIDKIIVEIDLLKNPNSNLEESNKSIKPSYQPTTPSYVAPKKYEPSVYPHSPDEDIEEDEIPF